MGLEGGLVESTDDDLTNLTWLQDQNLLKKLTPSSNGRKSLNELNENFSPEEDDVAGSNVQCSIPPITYNPQIHVQAKPPYSFSSLIFMAIESSPSKALPVKEIYSWIVDKFPHYRTAPSGWKNTVRHNLSLNKCFQKVDKAKDELSALAGKGSLWCIDPELRPNLLQAVRRTPAHVYPYMSAAKTTEAQFVRAINKTEIKQDFAKTCELSKVTPVISRGILIPSAKKTSRESKEADAVESMLTLIQLNSSNTGKSKSISDATIQVNDVRNSSCKSPTKSSVVVTLHPSPDHDYYSKITAEELLQDVSDGDASGASSSHGQQCDSDDEGFKGAEALLNLSKRRLSAQDNLIYIKKAKPSEK
ncbi:Forkhead box protein N2 [Halotydeus destructor]|nr:Forkhead box protein N2 [Halotydeus destructor]